MWNEVLDCLLRIQLQRDAPPEVAASQAGELADGSTRQSLQRVTCLHLCLDHERVLQPPRSLLLLPPPLAPSLYAPQW